MALSLAGISHLIAIDWFKGHGYQVYDINKHVNANGPDFTAIRDGRSYRVEVKSVNCIKNSLRVRAVTPRRRQDDYVAMVLLDPGVVIVQPMKEHLRLCAKDGTRFVTALFMPYF